MYSDYDRSQEEARRDTQRQVARHPLWRLNDRGDAVPALPVLIFLGLETVLAGWAFYHPASVIFAPQGPDWLPAFALWCVFGVTAIYLWGMIAGLKLMRFHTETGMKAAVNWLILLISPLLVLLLTGSVVFRAAPLLGTYLVSAPMQIELPYSEVRAGSRCLMETYRCRGRTSEYHRYLIIPGALDTYSRVILPRRGDMAGLQPQRFDAPLPRVVLTGQGNLFGLRIQKMEQAAPTPDG